MATTLRALLIGLTTAILVLTSLAISTPAQAEPSPGHDPALSECSDPLVPKLYANSGWRHRNLRMAWAIIMRESHGDENLLSGNDHGLFQLNSEGWGDTQYWPQDPFDGAQNIQAAYSIWQDHKWIPWGHNPDGSTAADHYPNWTDKQIRNWITKPYRKNYQAFPKDCKAWLKQN